MFRVEVQTKAGFVDARGEALKNDILDLGMKGVQHVRVVSVYWLEGDVALEDVSQICNQLLVDPVFQESQIYESTRATIRETDSHGVEVVYNAGVMDPVEYSLMKAILDLGMNRIQSVRTSKKYVIQGALSERDVQYISDKLLMNPVVEHILTEQDFMPRLVGGYRFQLIQVDLLDADDDGLIRLGRGFSLSLEEMKKVQGYFCSLGRNPTDVEMETFGQTWSEHCVHKTFKGDIRVAESIISNLLKSTIMRATEQLARPWCLSVFRDNAGVIDFDGHNALCFKVETHNHPSAIEPYGGASTGIGGVIRDPLGTGLGAKPIANTDVFCFGPPDLPHQELPRGLLHPRRVFKGVRAGVADYANRMGIPTVNGAVLFDKRYVGNPLVFCGTIGVLPTRKAQIGKHQPGDRVVLVGGRTGRDGIHGVTFASGELNEQSECVSSSSVQIGNPIVEKKLVDAILKARDQGLFHRITDCGGGGLSSAVGEMASDTGVRVDLELVPLKYEGLSYTEIWISEAQERMVLAVPEEKMEQLKELCANEDVEATVIGEFTDSGRLELFYEGHPVCDLDMDFLHHGLPVVKREALWNPTQEPEPDIVEPADLTEDLHRILSSWNVCSKEWVIRQYDHEVQGGTVIKPLVGVHNDGPSDACVIKPVLESQMGIVVSCGINPKYGDIDPYWMAASAIDEALRQVIAVGGSLEKVALLDNFCWGNPTKPDRLGALVRAAQACFDMSIAYGTPFISGKDSLYNEYEANGESICIPHTLLISAMAVMEDVRKAVSMDLKEAGDLIYLVGTTHKEMGGSHYYALHNSVGNSVPKVDPGKARTLMDALSSAARRGLIQACHDCSEGGLAVAAAEMAFSGDLGMTLHLDRVPLGEDIRRNDFILFSESNSRFLVEVRASDKDTFEEIMRGIDFAVVGEANGSSILNVVGLNKQRVVSSSLTKLKESWQRPLRW